MNATTINDLVAMVRDRVDPEGLVPRLKLERHVSEQRTEAFECHGDGSDDERYLLDELCERVRACIAAESTRRPGDHQIVFTLNVIAYRDGVGADLGDYGTLPHHLREVVRERDGRRPFATEQVIDGLLRLIEHSGLGARITAHAYGDPRIEVRAVNLTDCDLHPEDDDR